MSSIQIISNGVSTCVDNKDTWEDLYPHHKREPFEHWGNHECQKAKDKNQVPQEKHIPLFSYNSYFNMYKPRIPKHVIEHEKRQNTRIEQNKETIQKNVKVTKTNKQNITSNKQKIATNTSNIISNKQQINQNILDILTNKSSIATNLQNITSNKQDINKNTQDISNINDVLNSNVWKVFDE